MLNPYLMTQTQLPPIVAEVNRLQALTVVRALRPEEVTGTLAGAALQGANQAL